MKRRAFTLVELLVVIGVIALLIGILLPALIAARRAAQKAACLSNVQQLTKAVLLYVNDNRGYLPEAGSSNSEESLLSPRFIGQPAWTTIAPNTCVLPSISALLEKYLDKSGKLWQCPASDESEFVMTGGDPYGGTAAPDLFKPNYSYGAGKEMVPAMAYLPPAQLAQYRIPYWAARNVAGLRISQARPLGNQGAERVVLFQDRRSYYHSSGKPQIYDGVTADYYGSYGYLDGHAEGQRYCNVDEFLRQIHNPIPQRWFGQDFSALFASEYQ